MASGDGFFGDDGRLPRLAFFVPAAELAEGALALAGAGVHGDDLEGLAEKGFKDWDGGNGDTNECANAVSQVRWCLRATDWGDQDLRRPHGWLCNAP